VLQATSRFPNPAYEIFEWVARVMPGALVTFGIDLIIRLVRGLGADSTATAAKLVEQLMAVAMTVGLGAVVGATVAVLGRRLHRRPLSIGVIVAAICCALYLALVWPVPATTMLVSLVGFVAWGAILGASIAHTARHVPAARDRRRVLVVLASAGAAAGAVALGLGRLLVRGRRTTQAPASVAEQAGLTSGPGASPPLEDLAARFAPVPGTRPELTSNENFYRVDINLVPPIVDAADWRLDVSGAVERARTFSLDEIRAFPAISQMITLECISNPVGGDLIGTSRWTGLRVADLMRLVGVEPAARALVFEAADGFFESASLDELSDPRALLVYEMNGLPLPVEHGFPLRLYVPNRHGMKLPKWIQRIRAVEQPEPGYWVKRGWSATAIPHTTSVIDSARVVDTQTLAVGGIAYAGARGIQRVEVQIDDGAWREARLRTPALGPLTWVQWRLDLPYRAGRHTIRVRAYDGTGALQETRSRSAHPDGATGTDRKTITV
jgi:DMSO/TMAO reductase YedYZ molybdopterin-dependent catalytic subunit/chromate transport protein ChrA